MNDIRIPQKIWEDVKSHLFQDHGEHFGFFLSETVTVKNKTIFLVKEAIKISNDETEPDLLSLRIKTESLLRVINTANAKKLALVEIHNHFSGLNDVNFSKTDEKGFEEFVPYVLDSLPGMSYAALVTTEKGTFEGRAWNPEGKCSPVSTVKIVGEKFRKIITTSGKKTYSDFDESDSIYARQILAFGKEGQRKIQCLKVAIIGVGGIGSHLSQQLAYLGITDFVLVDPDKIEESNLNRLIGSTSKDIGKFKVDVTSNLIRSINSESRIQKFNTDLRNQKVFSELKDVDIIFGGLDNDGPRLILNQISFSYYIPYIDCATGIDPDENKIESAGGHVMIVQPEGPCMENCTRILDKKEASDFLATKEEYENRKKLGYIKGEDIKNPSVVSLNGTIASFAVNQLIKIITDIGKTTTLTIYDFLDSSVPSIVPQHLKIDKKCIHQSFKGLGDKIHLERFIKKEDQHNVN